MYTCTLYSLHTFLEMKTFTRHNSGYSGNDAGGRWNCANVYFLVIRQCMRFVVCSRQSFWGNMMISADADEIICLPLECCAFGNLTFYVLCFYAHCLCSVHWDVEDKDGGYRRNWRIYFALCMKCICTSSIGYAAYLLVCINELLRQRCRLGRKETQRIRTASC